MLGRLLLLLLATSASSLHIEELRSRKTHGALYQTAEREARLRNDTVIYYSPATQRVGVGFPYCRISSVFKAKTDVNRLLASEDEQLYSLQERIDTLLVPRLEKMRSAYCLKVEPAKPSDTKPPAKGRFDAVRDNPLETLLALLASVLILVVVSIVGGKCIGDLTRDPLSGQHSANNVPRTLKRLFYEIKDAQLSDNWRRNKVD